jgi:broad specificity phosphatase PhoE
LRGDLWLIRHGETAWSLSGQHTGLTDIPLTEHGREQAAGVANILRGHTFAAVLVSPLQRARETCRLAGYGDVAEVFPDLHEWAYGDYEGRSSVDIRAEHPQWSPWVDGFPNGETIDQVGARADSVIAKSLAAGGDVALFAHGHILRILTARWLGIEPAAGRLFALATATLSVLGYEHNTRVITRWNLTCAG